MPARSVHCKAAHHAPHTHGETQFCIEPVAAVKRIEQVMRTSRGPVAPPLAELPPSELVVLVWVHGVRHQVTVTETPYRQLLCVTDGVQSVLRRALADQS